MTTAVATKSEFNVLPLNAAEVLTVWDMLFVAIQESGLYQDSAIAQMLLDCMDGRQQAWLMRRVDPEGVKTLDGIIVTEIRNFPYTQDKVFQIVHLSTLNRSFDVNKWLQVNKALTRYAKREGQRGIFANKPHCPNGNRGHDERAPERGEHRPPLAAVFGCQRA